MFLKEINSDYYAQLIQTPFLRELIKEEKMCGYSMHDNATAQTANFSRSIRESHMANG